MKKNYCYASALVLCGALTFSSCSSNDDPLVEGPSSEEVATGEQVIILDMQDTDVVTSRSRPLYSTENKGAERVTDVKLLVFEHQGVNEPMKLIQTHHISAWDKQSQGYRYGQQYKLKLEGNDKLLKGEKYTILAIGQDEADQAANFSAPYKITATGVKQDVLISALNWTDLNQTWNASASVGKGFMSTAKHDNKKEAEIFSGISQPFTLNVNGGFSAEVLLKRQVAGVIGYFHKIPAFVKTGASNTADAYKAVKKIRLVSVNKNTQIDLTHNLDNQVDDATTVGKEHVMNGFTSATANGKFNNSAEGTEDAHVVYDIDLSQWFTTATGQEKEDGHKYWVNNAENIKWDAENFPIPTLGTQWTYPTDSDPVTITVSNWVNAIDKVNNTPKLADNSVLAGEFMIAFEKAKATETAHNTFELQLIGTKESGKEDIILKAWNVKLNQESIDAISQEDNAYQFNVYRNHMYQIGEHGTDNEPGKPQPLDKDQDLTIMINDQWEFIHDMEIE